MKFSPSKVAFYDPRLEAAYLAAKTWPSDLVDLSPGEAQTYAMTPPPGKRLGAVEGRPAWIDAPRFVDAEGAIMAVVRRIDSVTRQITGPVPEDEKASWAEKLAIARAVLADEATAEQAAMLRGEADETGESLGQLAGYIVARAQAYSAAIMRLTGIRRRMAAEIAAAAGPADYGAIVDKALADIDDFVAGIPA